MRHLGSDGQELQTLAFIYEEIDAELDQALREQEAKVGVNYIVVTISALLQTPNDLFRMVLHALVRKVGRTRGPRFFGLLSTRAVVRGSTQMQQKG